MKKFTALLAAALMTVALVTGCSGGGEGSGASTSEPAPAASASGASSTADAPSGEAVELMLWHMEEPANRVEAFQSVINRFNDSHENINVSIEVQSWGDAYTEIPAAIMGGNGPDILATIPDHCTVIYELGAAQDVSDMVGRLNSTYSFHESALSPYVYSDGTYAIPAFGMGQVLWYRVDLFEQAGLSAPTTFEELLACAEALTGDGVNGIALPASLSMATDQVIYSFLASAGATNVIDGESAIHFDNEGTVAAYDTYNKLLAYAPVDCDTYTWGEPQALLNAGTVAMAIEKGQYLATFESESGTAADNLGCVRMPVLESGMDSTSIYYSNGFIVLSEDAAKQAAIEEFFTFLLSEEAYGDFLNAEPGLFVPVTSTGAGYESWLSNDVLKKFPSQVETLLAATSDGALFGFTDGVCMNIGKITGPNLLAQTLQQMTVNGLSAEEAVAWGAEQMSAAIS